MFALVLSIGALILSLGALCYSIVSYRRIVKVRDDLDENYWTKGVVGRTIDSKTDRDPSAVDELAQDKELKK